ncbi:MAG: hypothetical protein JNM00_03975, partial [Flavobacteriales bacterium]|nr:hypothetical protein [Flavobacteriales bacterium]
DESDPALANAHALRLLANGADAITFLAPVNSQNDFERLVLGIQLEILDVEFTAADSGIQLLQWIADWCASHHVDAKALRGGLRHANAEITDNDYAALLSFASDRFSLFRIWMVNASVVHETGGTTIQEIVTALGLGSEFLHRAEVAGFSVDQSSAMLHFQFGIGTGYFEEMAKLRAFRYLWSEVIAAFIPSHDCSYLTYVTSACSLRNQTTADIHNNLLRTTTEAMSAIIAGTDSILVRAYNQVCGTTDPEGERLAANIYHLLHEESHLIGPDAVSGAHYIEALSSRLAMEAWNEFLALESAGGYFLSESRWSDEIQRAADKRKEKETSGKRVIIGVNKYRQS